MKVEEKKVTVANSEQQEGKKKSILAFREQQVMKCLLLVIPTKQIPKILGIEMDTVRTHIRNMHLRTKCHSPAEQILWALADGYTVDHVQKKVWWNGVEII